MSWNLRTALWARLTPLLEPGRPQPAEWRRYLPVLELIRRRESELRARDGLSLEQFARELRGCPPGVERTIDAFAVACVAAERVLGLNLFDVQLIGALVMHDGKVAEMETGEGKTLAAVLTIFANSLDGAGVHVWTANDYLARRDALWMGPVFRSLGVSVGFLNQGMSATERRAAYASDVTYATANEVGFDYLRDGLSLHPRDLTQRPFAVALIDEVDSILIDEARIPLVIAGDATRTEQVAGEMARIVAGLSRNFGLYN